MSYVLKSVPCRVLLFTGYSIGLPVLRQSLIPSGYVIGCKKSAPS